MKVLFSVYTMQSKIVNWIGLISVIAIGLVGFRIYVTFISFIASFIIGIFTVLYFSYDKKKIFPEELDTLDDPLQQTSLSFQSPKIIEIFQCKPQPEKFDNRITGSDTVDSFLNEIITIIINDFVTPWYEVITDDNELTTQAIRKLVLAAGVNVSNRIKNVDWIHILSTRVPEQLTTHLKLFKQSRVRLKHVHLMNAKDMSNGSPEKKLHKRNKSDTDLCWPYETTACGKSKFYDSTENICSTSSTLKDIFFDLECSIENRQLCRDVFCMDPEKEYALLTEISEAILYLVAPVTAWKCASMKLMLIELLSAVVLRPLINLLSDPDNINRTIIRMCCRDNILPVELFLTVLRASTDAEELDATLELVQKDIQKLHSKDSAGEWDLQDRQKLSSLQYLTRIIQARRATLGPQEGLSSTTDVGEKVSEEVTRTLKLLSATTAWRSNAQYCLEIELLSDTDSPHTSKTVIDSLRSSALELCDTFLASNRPALLGVPENYYSDLVRKITTDGEEFTNNPVSCFDDLQKYCYDALEDDPSWQSDYMLDNENEPEKINSDHKKEEKLERKYSGKCKKFMKTCFAQLPKVFKHKMKCGNAFSAQKASTFPRSVNKRMMTNKNHTLPKCSNGDVLQVPGVPRHNRSRSDIVGNTTQKLMNESAGPSNLSTANASNMSMSHSDISRSSRNTMTPLSASIIETALVQDKGKSFGIYAVSVTRLSDKEVWHIYRRYSDFHDLHSSIKDKWPELADLPFPAKKAFQNTSRSVLESRKRILNSYLQSLANLARDPRYAALWSQEYLGGFLSPENQSGKHSNFIDVIFVNSLRAGMRTLKNMPDQFVNTVDGVMDGISKVFQGKSDSGFDTLKTGITSDCPEDGGYESVALRLLEEILGIRGLWLRRRLLAPLRTIIADRVNKKVYEFVASLTSPRNVVQYLKTFKEWLITRGDQNYSNRDPAIRARARVTAKVALLSACSDDLKHIVGSDTAKRGLLTFFDLFQTQEINKRLIYVLLEDILTELFPDNNIPGLFKKIYTNSARVPVAKKSVNL